MKSTTAAYSKHRMSGGKTCHFCTQLERFFLTCTRLDATDGKYETFDKEKGGEGGIYPFTQVCLLSETWKRG